MKRTIAIIITSLLLAGFVSGCTFQMGTSGTEGDGKVTSEKIDVKDFNGVILDSLMDVNISFAESYSVTVTTDSNLQKFVKVTVENGALNIASSESIGNDILPTKLVVDVTLPKIQTLELSGSGTMTLADGNGEAIKILHSGSGEISAEKYQVKNATIEASGSGNIKVWATDSLNGSLSGAGDLFYKGTPKVDVATDGAGEVQPISE